YFTLKWSTRLCNKLNRGIVTTVNIPEGRQKDLEQWIAEVRKPYELLPKQQDDSSTMTLFSDASKFGWGAVLISPQQQVFIAGGAWSSSEASYAANNINLLEAAALNYAVSTFDSSLQGSHRLEIRVDNTSVESALRRGVARSLELNQTMLP